MLGADEILKIQTIVDRVIVSDYCIQYVADIVRRTRPTNPDAPPFIGEMFDWGAGPRAGQYLIRGAKAIAAMEGRYNIAPDDIRRVAAPVMRHRIGTNFQAEASGITPERIVEMLIDRIPEPTPE